ncbi:MAG: hypothetical protein WC043_02115 [Pseudobdellovibrionaceae bacterium]
MTAGFERLVADSGVDKTAIGTLIDRVLEFKATERKDDPTRRLGLHGPYEELVLMHTGKLPSGYYEEGDEQPWGLREGESRSNILWQVLSGMMDQRPEFAAAYMGLALDKGVSGDDYERELGKLHGSWSDFNRKSRLFNHHQHSAMRRHYHTVACPACSALTAMVCQDEAMMELFQKLVPLKPSDRQEYLAGMGFGALLTITLPEVQELSTVKP